MAEQPIIIKRIKRGHAAHHGGAWKVAYADFVTAMMAFFLLLWLLNAVTEEQLQGIADYFAPSTASKSESGAGAMLDGGSVTGKGAMTSDRNSPSFSLSLPPPTIGEGGDALTDPKEGGDDGGMKGTDQNSGQAQAVSEKEIVEANSKREQQQFDRAQEALKQAMNSIPELAKLADSLMVDNTPEGLRIQIVDQDGLAMFPKGSPDMYGHTHALMDLVGKVVKKLPERISISGHTDGTPFSGQSNYTNWELSADRALATRRALLTAGVPSDRVDRVVGRADQEPLMHDDPNNARNRRITIVLLRETQPVPTVEVTPDAARSGNLPAGLVPGGSPAGGDAAPAQALPPQPKPAETRAAAP